MNVFPLVGQYIVTGARYDEFGAITLEDGSTIIDPAAGGLGVLRQEGEDCNIVHLVSDSEANFDDIPCNEPLQENLRNFACSTPCNGF